MQSLKSERSYQDFLSPNESEFLSTYFVQLIGDTIPQYVTQSELAMRHQLGQQNIDIQQILQEKRSLHIKPNRYMFSQCDFQLENGMHILRNLIQKYDFQNNEEKKSPQTRRKLYASLITSSFSDDIPICEINSWITLNDIKLEVKKGDILLFIVKIKASSNILNRLQTLIQNEINYTKTQINDYITNYKPNIYPILILNADINFSYQNLNCQAYYIGKQNLMYHFFQQMRVQDAVAITEDIISKYNINRMSQTRILVQREALKYQKLGKKVHLFKLTTFGVAITLGLVYIFKKKIIK